MIRRAMTYTCLISMFMLTACSEKEDGHLERCIMMRATVGDIKAESKAVSAKPYEGTDPAEMPLAADLWFSFKSGEYGTIEPTDTYTYIPCHTTATFTSAEITAINYDGDQSKALKYPTGDDKTIYCVGFYPQKKWSFTEDKTFSAVITGEDDLMFAPELSGKWDNQFCTSEENSQHFRHMLTWIKIVVCATSDEAASTWGDIQTVSLTTAETITINAINAAEVAYDGSQDLVIIDENHTLSVNLHEAGSVFCAPAASVIITVTGENGLSASKEIRAPGGGFMAGNQYIIVLYFNELSVIDGVCSLSSWDNENDNLYLNKE